MPIVVPKERRIICSDDERYKIPINILTDSEKLTMSDELLIEEMTRYTPATAIREGDVLYMTQVPPWLYKKRGDVPRWWKVRFVVSYWAYYIMNMATKVGGGITLDHAVKLLEDTTSAVRHNARLPMVFATAFPHGENENSAEWLPTEVLRRTTFVESTHPWRVVTEKFKTAYRGYELRPDLRWHFDLEPDDYTRGQCLGRPFDIEEPLVEDMYACALEESLHVPYRADGVDKMRKIARDHDIFNTKE